MPSYIDKKTLKRFWAKVNKTKTCWDWVGCIEQQYGTFQFLEKKIARAHRASWIIHNGPIPDGLLVLHKCDRPSCVNPSHLFLGTQKDNVRDMFRKRRQPNFKGELHPMAKLTTNQVKLLREVHKEFFVSAKALGEWVGLSGVAMARVLNCKNYSDVK